MPHHKLVVAVRCHLWPHLVLDTVASVFRHSRTFPLVVVSSDNNPVIGPAVQAKFPQVLCYTSDQRWGWGPGLYGLLSSTISWLDAQPGLTYDHFLTIDYDTIIIGDAWDEMLLQIAGTHPTVGLAGSYIPRSANWQARVSQSERAIRDLFASRSLAFPPPAYIYGESCLGGAMLLTKACLDSMRRLRLFDAPFRDIRDLPGKIADDPWTALMVRAAGFGIFDTKSIQDYAHIAWQHAGNWREYPRRGLKLFNLGGISRAADKREELMARNFFRKLRRERFMLPVEAGNP